MRLDAATLAAFTRPKRPKRFLRVTPLAHEATPLGMGFGATRFASPSDSFKVLYLGQSLPTAVAETLIRDRFVGKVRRRLPLAEVELWGVTEVSASAQLNLLDLTGDALLALGVHTDALRAKSQRRGRAFSAMIYDQAPGIDGLFYPSRLRNTVCVVVYDRAVPRLTATPVVPLIVQPGLRPGLDAMKVTIFA